MKYPALVRHLFLLSLALTPGLTALAFDAGADNFASAPQINTARDTSLVTDLTGFTKEIDEPGHNPGGGSGAEKTAWWSWTAPEDGLCTVDTFPSTNTFNPVRNSVLAVYTGATVDALTPVAKNASYTPYNGGPSNLLSRVTFSAQQGTVYHIAVDAQSGTFSPSESTVAISVRLLALRKATRTAVFTTEGVLGSITVNQTATGALSGKMLANGQSYAFAGALGMDGLFTTSFIQKRPPNGAQPLPITLQLDATGQGQYVLYYGSNAYAYNPLPERVIFTSPTQNTTVGLYPVYMESASNNGGNGAFSFTVKSNGQVTGAGTAIDGSRITFSSALHAPSASMFATYVIPFYASTFKGKGGLVLDATVNEGGLTDELGGSYSFIRPAVATSAFYPAGFNDYGDFIGSTYRKPVKGSRALDFLSPTGDGVLEVINSNAELQGDLLESLNLSEANRFTFLSTTNKPSLKLNAATGQVTGSITELGGKKRLLKGVLTKNGGTPVLRGYVSGLTQTLWFEVR